MSGDGRWVRLEADLHHGESSITEEDLKRMEDLIEEQAKRHLPRILAEVVTTGRAELWPRPRPEDFPGLPEGVFASVEEAENRAKASSSTVAVQG